MPPNYRPGHHDQTGKCSPEMAAKIVALLMADPSCSQGLFKKEPTNNDPGGMMDRTCPTCKATFQARNYRSRKARVYCSGECYRNR